MSKTKEENNYRAETCRSPLGETGDYDSWIELVTPDFNLQCHDPNVELEQVEELANLLNSADQFKPEWIKCSDQLPPFEEKVIILTDDEQVIDARLSPDDGGFWIGVIENYALDQVTHWMPLPPTE